jgi:hypothetical protein
MLDQDMHCLPGHPASSRHVCQSCGRWLEKGKKRYCRRDCKDEFVFKLKWFNNLLRALDARFATFFFTETVLILNILPATSREVRSYFYPRRIGVKPSQDMNHMVFELGQIWWGHKERTKSRRGASRLTLSRGQTGVASLQTVRPVELLQGVTVGKQLKCLRIPKEALMQSEDAEQEVKRAFRKAALEHHPDTGGDAVSFQKVHQAYLELLAWLKKPRYQIRRGVAGQWGYMAGRSSWLPPL